MIKASKKPKKDVRRHVVISTGVNGGIAGWCAKIKTPETQVDKAAEFRASDVRDALEAEVKAAACGLALANVRELLHDQPLVLLQMGSAEAIAVVLASDCRYEYSAGPYRPGGVPVVPRAVHVPARCVEAVAAIRKIRDATGAVFRLRLVAA